MSWVVAVVVDYKPNSYTKKTALVLAVSTTLERLEDQLRREGRALDPWIERRAVATGWGPPRCGEFYTPDRFAELGDD